MTENFRQQTEDELLRQKWEQNVRLSDPVRSGSSHALYTRRKVCILQKRYLRVLTK